MTTTKTLFTEKYESDFDSKYNYWHLRAWVIAVIVAVVGVLVIVGTAVGAMQMEKKGCTERAQQLEVPFDWGVWSGCNYEIDGTWIPADNYIVNEQK